MVANFMLCLAHFSVNPLVATYAEYLDASPQIIGIIAGMFFGVALAMRPFAGPVTTKFDKRKLLIFVFILGVVANLGYAVFRNIPAFVGFRIINGIQFSLVGMLLMTLAADHLPKAKLASGIGIFGISGAAASAVAPSIGDAMIRLGTSLRSEGFGFMLMFLFGAAVFTLAIIPAAMLAPDYKSKEELASTGAWYKNIFTIHALPTTIIMFLLIIPHAIVHTFMFDFGREQGIGGISVFYLVLALTLALSRPLGGIMIDRFGIAKIMFPGLALNAAALLLIGSSTALWMLIAGAVILAFGVGSSHPTLQAMCMQTEAPIKRGVASNTIYIGLDLGLFLGPVLGNAVRIQTDFAVMYTAAAIPVGLAIVCLAVILPIHRRRVASLDG
jgi:MFS family permease